MPEAACSRAPHTRMALASLFAVNGASFATVLPRYPGLKADLGLSNAVFGAVVAAGPLGALLVGATAGMITARWGSARVAVVGSLGLSVNLVLIALAPSSPAFAVLLLAVALGVAGCADTVADVPQNVHGLRVQRLLGRSVINSLHGAWSVGAVAGGIAGSLAAGAAVPLVLHLGGWAALALCVVAWSSRRLPPGADARPERAARGRRPAGGQVVLLLLLGLLAASANLVEDAASVWGAIHLSDLGAGAATAGMGFVALQALQIVGRLTGDHWVMRFGDRAVARAGGALVVLGGLLVVVPDNVGAAVAGFGAAGLGVATLIPASLRAADDVPGLAPGTGIAVVGTVLRLALVASPPVVGLVADATSLRAGLLVVARCGGAAILLSGRLEERRHPT
ncbi:MAG: MFS transporter [Phycicoccus sp.]